MHHQMALIKPKFQHLVWMDLAETICSRSVVFSPSVVTQKSMSELWRIIIDESQGHYAGLRREASEASSTNSPSPSSLSSVPIDLSGLYF